MQEPKINREQEQSVFDSLPQRRTVIPFDRLPDAIIGGAPRSGTTYLCHLLAKHPGIYVATPYIPEPKVCLTPHPEGVAGYQARYAQLFAPAAPGQLLVEKSSAYLENSDALERLRRVLRRVKFIFIVREPVSRAYSNYLRSRENGLETLSFAEAVDLEGQRRSPFPPDREYVRPFDYMVRGDYALFAERYYEAFGREQVCFCLYEDIGLRLGYLCRTLQDFLGVPPLPHEQLAVGRINAAKERGSPLDPSLEKQLRDSMRPKVEKFSALTGLNLDVWGY